MYEAFYGLNGKPFNLTPDPRFLYLSQKHKEAFAHLVYGVQNRSGFVMITGEIGTGKTTICRSLLSQLDDDTELAFIFNPILSPEEMLQKINEEFGIDTKAESVKDLIDELNEYLLDCAARGKNCVLVIDEAQNLDPKLLEQIRLLSNLETETQKLLQILLIGQPELVEKLRLPELRQLNQRITARYHLKGLDRKETREYIAFRLRVAGGLRKVRFTRSAVRIIYNVSKGTPRVINAICDRALLIGYTQESYQINAKIVRRAAREIQGEKVKAPRQKRQKSLMPRFAAAAAVIVAGLAIGSYLVVSKETRASFLDDTRVAFDRLMPGDQSAEPMRVVSASTADEAPSNAMQTEGDSADTANAADTTSKPAPTGPKPNPDSDPTENEPAETGESGAEFEEAPTTAAAPNLFAKASPPQSAVEPESSSSGPAPEPADTITAADRWPEVLDPDKALQNALAALLAAWDVEPVAPFPAAITESTIQRFAADHGLAYTFVNPTLDQLLTLNVPALTRVDSLTKQVWVALVEARPKTFRLSSSDGNFASVDRELFARHYAKESVILWRDPQPNAPVINPWTTGPQVEAFQSELAALGFLSEPDATYDRETIELVKRIQRAAGLTVDGIVGPQTRLLLAQWSAAGSMPTLTDKAFPESIRRRVLSIVAPDSKPNETEREPVAETSTNTAASGSSRPSPWTVAGSFDER